MLAFCVHFFLEIQVKNEKIGFFVAEKIECTNSYPDTKDDARHLL